jgi:LysM repeat protein
VAYVSAETGRSARSLIGAAAGEVTHTVQPSETLWAIAREYGTTPARIRETNGLTSSVIHAGQRLAIPD